MAKSDSPFRWFDSSPEVIQLVVMLYVRCPLSPRNVEDLAFERGIDMRHETVRKWVNRFGPMFASKIRKRRVHANGAAAGGGASVNASLVRPLPPMRQTQPQLRLPSWRPPGVDQNSAV